MVLDSSLGTRTNEVSFPWTLVTSVLQTRDVLRVTVSGVMYTNNVVTSNVASCLTKDKDWSCTAKSFVGTTISSGAQVPFVDKFIYVGTTQSMHVHTTIIDDLNSIVRSFVYTSTVMSSIVLLQVRSPPLFIGGFVAGIGVSAAGLNYIIAGMVRCDSGAMTGMFIAPASGSIVNSAELVNAMALEYEHPDIFIAGGLQLNDGRGMNAYMLRVNSLYRRVVFGIRYVARFNRRILLEGSEVNRAVKGMVLVGSALYLLVDVKQSSSVLPQPSVSILKTDAHTGSIMQQVHIHSRNASIQCTDVSAAGLFLILACVVQYPSNTTEAVVVSVSNELTFSTLPKGFMRLEQDTFVAETVDLKGSVLPLMMHSDVRTATEHTFDTANHHPTIYPTWTPTRLPSFQPSSAPSGQPSSSPTAAPSVSPQPSSQPSTSGPTNTYKPTVKPTLRPTARSSVPPTVQPSQPPSALPTTQPTAAPSMRPSTMFTIAPSSTAPTRAPSAKPTRHPTVRGTCVPTFTPTLVPTIPGTVQKERKMYRESESVILGQVVGGLIALWCVYLFHWWWQYKLRKLQEDKRRVKEMIAEDLPGKPRYPIFSAIVSLCCPFELTGNTESAALGSTVSSNGTTTLHTDIPATSTLPAASVVSTSDRYGYNGQGAYMDAPKGFVDLEANIPHYNDNNSGGGTRSAKEMIIKKDQVQSDLPTTALVATETVYKTAAAPNPATDQGEGIDRSEISSISDESTDAPDSESSNNPTAESLGVVQTDGGVEGSYLTRDMDMDMDMDMEPSDDGDIVYTISSSEEG